ncbi:MAG: hypothetical protein QMD71_03475 [bacterium]|nr:hypothetical protein [bacterium]
MNKLKMQNSNLQLKMQNYKPQDLHEINTRLIFSLVKICVICGFLLLGSAYCYSLFSGGGLGEPVEVQNAAYIGMGGIQKFKLPSQLTFEFSMVLEIVDEDGKATNFDFTLPYVRYVLPLPKEVAPQGMGIDIGLNEVLNLNFDIHSPWEELYGDSVQRRVKSRGSASIGKIGIGKNFSSIAVELGGFVVFGSAQEEWVTDFKTMHDAYDTLRLKFFGPGYLASIGLDFWKFGLSASYLSHAKLTSNTNLPSRVVASISYTPIEKATVEIGVTSWQWSSPFKPMNRVSVGGKYEISPLILRCGFYTNNWYYGDIKERVGALGLGIPLKSLCTIDLSFEFGKRWNPILEERIYRACITLQGKESLM